MITKRKTKSGVIYQVRVKVKGSLVFKNFDTFNEAEQWQTSVRYRRDKGRVVVHDSVTIQQMFDAYLEHAQEKGTSAGTLGAAKARFKNHVLPGYGPNLDMTTVTHEEHQQFLTMLMKKGVKPATRNRIRTLVRVLYSVSIKNRLFGGVFQVNPFDSVGPAREPWKAIEYWNPEQSEQFLNANRDNHYYPLFVLLLRTGLRIGEALGIHPEQIDKTTHLLTVDRQFDSTLNQIVHTTKGKRIRHVYLVDEVLDALLPRLGEGPLFRKEDGSTLTPDHFRRAILPRACKQAGLKVINPHATRHTFASHYLMQGGDLWDLSKILGHSSTEVTEQRYGHFDLKHVRKRMLVIERKENVLRANFGKGGS